MPKGHRWGRRSQNSDLGPRAPPPLQKVPPKSHVEAGLGDTQAGGRSWPGPVWSPYRDKWQLRPWSRKKEKDS